MAKKKKSARSNLPGLNLQPDQREVTARQAEHLSSLARVDPRRLAGRSLADLHEELRWRIDPELLCFRRICGRVVKRDPATGDLQPVPNATVHVEDTDCSFIGLFPQESPYFWLFPTLCRREILTRVTTDECGRFCVYLSCWEIDRYLRFRRERICIGEIRRPSIGDLIDRVRCDPRVCDPPRLSDPRLPDPPPFDFDPTVIDATASVLGRDAADRLELASSELAAADLGERRGLSGELLEAPAFDAAVPPPLPSEFFGGDANNARRALPIDKELLAEVDFGRFTGPFLRCRDVIVAEWTTVRDVPDLTFRVTQDVDADGEEEEIYSEGFFDVRWDAGSIPDVTLIASEEAISVPHCQPVAEIDCEDRPAIVTAGYMPLEASHHDAATGTAIRVNRPRDPGGLYADAQSGDDGHAPYAATLNLHGCHRTGDSTHYRLLYSHAGNAEQPFTGLSWWAPRQGPGGPILFTPDAEGWYPILPEGDLAHPNWLLSWPTRRFDNGVYDVRLELGTAGGGAIGSDGQSDPERFLIDNTRPALQIQEIRWRPATVPVGDPWTDANSTLLPTVCPVIDRPSGQAIHLRVRWSASAAHLRNAHLSAYGCGGGGFGFLSDVASRQRWHTSSAETSVARTTVLALAAVRPAGCYTIALTGSGRQFNPSGFDHGPSQNWYINQATFSTRHTSRAVSVVDV